MPAPTTDAAVEGLLLTVFQQLRQAKTMGLAIALSSANAGEGVTHTMEALLGGLRRDRARRTLAVDARDLRELGLEAGDPLDLCVPVPGATSADGQGLHQFTAPGPGGRGGAWRDSWEYRRDVIDRFREDYDYVLIDCPALRTSNDLLASAPFVDGILLVVEANRTRREQILHAERAIDFARGKLLGHILNKRTYKVPEWLFHRL